MSVYMFYNRYLLTAVQLTPVANHLARPKFHS